MIVITILLGLMLLGSGLFIFYLMQVLKNTYKASKNVIEMSEGLDRLNKGESYDGKYYPGTVISNILFTASITYSPERHDTVRGFAFEISCVFWL